MEVEWKGGRNQVRECRGAVSTATAVSDGFRVVSAFPAELGMRPLNSISI